MKVYFVSSRDMGTSDGLRSIVSCFINMTKKQEKCNHEFQTFGDEPVYRIGGLGETLKKEVICKKCGLRAREIYLYSCVIADGDEVIVQN